MFLIFCSSPCCSHKCESIFRLVKLKRGKLILVACGRFDFMFVFIFNIQKPRTPFIARVAKMLDGGAILEVFYLTTVGKLFKIFLSGLFFS